MGKQKEKSNEQNCSLRIRRLYKSSDNNPFIKDLLSVFIFLMITICSMTLINNVNECFFYFIILGFIYFLALSIHDFIKIYPALKQRIKTREKLNLTKDFKYYYTGFILSLLISMTSIFLMMTNMTCIILLGFGLFFSYYSFIMLMEKQEDLNKINIWSKKICNSVSSKTDC